MRCGSSVGGVSVCGLSVVVAMLLTLYSCQCNHNNFYGISVFIIIFCTLTIIFIKMVVHWGKKPRFFVLIRHSFTLLARSFRSSENIEIVLVPLVMPLSFQLPSLLLLNRKWNFPFLENHRSGSFIHRLYIFMLLIFL